MDNSKNKFKYISSAVLAAVLYGISAPFSKLILKKLSPTFLAALLYLGAGFGMLLISIYRTITKKRIAEAKITKKELPYIIGTVALDIAAPIFLMIGVANTAAANASLLNNFEMVATSVIALMVFKEAVGRRMWIAIALITAASMILSIEDISSFSFSLGSAFVILACLCWGFENNLTRKLSIKDPLQIVVIKGLGSGLGALIVCIVLGQLTFDILYVVLSLLLGFVAFGLSIYFYIKAQRQLGAARTSAYYAAAPFVGVLVSFIVLREGVPWTFFVALVIMIAGAYFAVTESHKHIHLHEEVTHDHRHSHDDGHHNHVHEDETEKVHSHEHTHEELEHAHEHHPDVHHRHSHK